MLHRPTPDYPYPLLPLVALMIVTGVQLVGALIWLDAFNGTWIFVAIYVLNSIAVFVYSLYTIVHNRASFIPAPTRSS